MRPSLICYPTTVLTCWKTRIFWRMKVSSNVSLIYFKSVWRTMERRWSICSTGILRRLYLCYIIRRTWQNQSLNSWGLFVTSKIVVWRLSLSRSWRRQLLHLIEKTCKENPRESKALLNSFRNSQNRRQKLAIRIFSTWVSSSVVRTTSSESLSSKFCTISLLTSWRDSNKSKKMTTRLEPSNQPRPG